MNDVHLHLFFNHFPAIATAIGFAVLLTGLALKNIFVNRTALVILIAAGLIAIPAFLTGEGAEEMVEHLPGVSHDLIHAHEEDGEAYIWASVALGIVSLFALLFDLIRNRRGLVFYIPVLILCIFCLIMGARTGTSGAEIRHPEIRDDYNPE